MSAKKLAPTAVIEIQNQLIAYLIQIISHTYQTPNPVIKPEVEGWLESTITSLGHGDLISRFQNLKTLTKCNKCYTQLSNYRLNCKHLICESCLCSSVEYASEKPIDSCLSLACPVCSFSHSSRDIKGLGIAENSKVSTLLKNYQKKRVASGIDHICQSCKQQLKTVYFPEQQPCTYHSYCKECLTQFFVEGRYNCHHCVKTERFKSDPSKEKGVCSGCSKEVFYLGDCLTRVCEDHFHCFECLDFDLQHHKCKTCASVLTEETIAKIAEKTYKTCACCEKKYPCCLFLNKSCCTELICAFCQANNEENLMNCLKCKDKLLEPASLELVLEVRASLEEIANP